MANKPNAAPAQAAPQATTPAPAAAPASTAGVMADGQTRQGSAIILKNGEPRAQYIRRRFGEGAKRGEIAKELGVPYQIVFAATKTKKAEAAAPAAAPAQAASK